MMRRLDLALAAAIVLLAMSAPASADYRKVIRDCTQDGKLGRGYTRKDLRTALKRLPTDVRKYTDCAGEIRAALENTRARTSGGWHHASYHCHPHDARTLKDNGEVRVYSVSVPDGRRVWACLYRTGSRSSLGYNADFGLGGSEKVAPIRLAGSLVGWRYVQDEERQGSRYRVAVHDMRTGRTLHRFHQSGTGADDPCGFCHAWYPYGLVMDHAGSIAWIAVRYGFDGEGWAVVVFKSDARRGAERLDSSTSIDPLSLRRHGKVISWRHGGETRIARFVR